MLTTKKTSKLHITGSLRGARLPSQKFDKAESISMSWLNVSEYLVCRICNICLWTLITKNPDVWPQYLPRRTPIGTTATPGAQLGTYARVWTTYHQCDWGQTMRQMVLYYRNMAAKQIENLCRFVWGRPMYVFITMTCDRRDHVTSWSFFCTYQC